MRRGADNPTLDTYHHPELEISHNGKYNKEFYHKPTGINYHIHQSGTVKSGSPRYTVIWNHSHPGKMSSKTARHTLRNANKVWDDHIVHRLPYKSVVHNHPTPTYKRTKTDYVEKNTRAKLYQRKGFGPLKDGDQYARVGRNVSWKQKLKRKSRLTPLQSEND